MMGHMHNPIDAENEEKMTEKALDCIKLSELYDTDVELYKLLRQKLVNKWQGKTPAEEPAAAAEEAGGDDEGGDDDDDDE